MRRSLCAGWRVLCVVRCLLRVVCYVSCLLCGVVLCVVVSLFVLSSLFSVRCSLLVVCCAAYGVRRWFVVCYTVCVVCCLVFVCLCVLCVVCWLWLFVFWVLYRCLFLVAFR